MKRFGGGDLGFAGLAGGTEGDPLVLAVQEVYLAGIWAEAERGDDPGGGRGLGRHFGRGCFFGGRRGPILEGGRRPGTIIFVARH